MEQVLSVNTISPDPRARPSNSRGGRRAQPDRFRDEADPRPAVVGVAAVGRIQVKLHVDYFDVAAIGCCESGAPFEGASGGCCNKENPWKPALSSSDTRFTRC